MLERFRRQAVAVALGGILSLLTISASQAQVDTQNRNASLLGTPFADLVDGFEPLARTEAGEGVTREVFFATNRNPIPLENPKGFGIEISPDTRFGAATMVSLKGEWTLQSLRVSPLSVMRLLGARPSVTRQLLGLDDGAGFGAVELAANSPYAAFANRVADPDTDVLVFVHGAAFTFDGALSTAARLSELYRLHNRKIVVLAFSYPTNGIFSPWDYFDDRDEAGQSGYAFNRAFEQLLLFLADLRQEQPLGRTIFMAHSLGAFATRVAVQAIDGRSARPPRVFDYAFIMAGDDDRDTLSENGKMRPILQMTRGLIVYHANNDTLMLLSSTGNRRRPIGFHGPSDLNSADYGDVTVQSIDVRDFSTVGDSSGHRYYTNSPRVVEDAVAILLDLNPDEISGRKKIGARGYRLVGN